ncbi:MAG: putative toxin-antitoxin system toxin component, PIN family [Spirochaetes bacterium]|nr:putative toxin-antitoxin system toxin component, PIN family [Spirochaetota bacterium]
MRNLKFVLDTNILLVSISDESQFHWIFNKIKNKKIDLVISNDILTEYNEIISQKFNFFTAEYVCEFLSLASNVHKVTPYFFWNLIDADKDDNKFVDCAIASNADYIVTNDKHFDVLKNIEFPKINIINFNEFTAIIK